MLQRLSIQSKLILMMLSVAIGSIIVVGSLGYLTGRRALERAADEHLSGLLNVRRNQIESYLKSVRAQVVTLAESRTTVLALREFLQIARELETEPFSTESEGRLAKFYDDVFLPELAKRSSGRPERSIYVPRTNAGRHLQERYLARSTDIPYTRKSEIDSIGDGSGYDEVHARYHPGFRRIVESLGFADLFLIDADTGQIVYSQDKTTEFGTNLVTGPYADSNLGRLFASVRRGMQPGDYRFADFERYAPNLNAPCAFVASGVFDQGRMVGVLALQFPIEEINRRMTGNLEWEAEGLGKTGEIYLVGPDSLLRSRSRFHYQDPEGTLRELEVEGVPRRVIEAIRRDGVLILNLEIRGEAVEKALAGKQGVVRETDYRGYPVLTAFGPLEADEFRWAIIAEMDLDEVLAPVHNFGRLLLIVVVGLVLLVTLIALGLSHMFVRPIKKLTKAARRVEAGDLSSMVRIASRDEFGELASAFNAMTRGLRVQADQLEKKVQENEELLLNILPAPAAERLKRDGEAQGLTQSFADVTVLFAGVIGFDEIQEGEGAGKGVELLDEFVVALDEAADRFGVEKVNNVGTSYLAVCGLSVQRPDHVNRMLDFAGEILRIVRRFNQAHATTLVVEIGVNAGPVVGGVVGRKKFIYDLWGETVSLARILASDGITSVQVTQSVRDRAGDLYAFEPGGEVALRGKEAVCTWNLIVTTPTLDEPALAVEAAPPRRRARRAGA